MRKKEKVITHGTNTIYLIGLLYTLSFFFCSTDQEQDNTSPIESPLTGPYTIESSQLLENGQEVHFKGVNALQTYGLTDAGLMNHWKVQITREFIGNLREQPIDGVEVLDEISYYDYGKFLHIMDDEGNKIELWEPVDIVFTTMGGKTTK